MKIHIFSRNKKFFPVGNEFFMSFGRVGFFKNPFEKNHPGSRGTGRGTGSYQSWSKALQTGSEALPDPPWRLVNALWCLSCLSIDAKLRGPWWSPPPSLVTVIVPYWAAAWDSTLSKLVGKRGIVDCVTLFAPFLCNATGRPKLGDPTQTNNYPHYLLSDLLFDLVICSTGPVHPPSVSR